MALNSANKLWARKGGRYMGKRKRGRKEVE